MSGKIELPFAEMEMTMERSGLEWEKGMGESSLESAVVGNTYWTSM